MDQPHDIPIMIETLVYRRVKNTYEFLCIKRTEEDGGWWQPVIGHMQSNESLPQALFRELKEETGIVNYVRLIEDVWHFHWEHKGEMHLEFVYALEVDQKQDIQLNPEEHDMYTWSTIDEAINLFKFDNNKNALRQFQMKYINKTNDTTRA